MRVLQYGVTRDALRDVLEEAEGWDIIHISGHGGPGELLLETAAGKPDRVTGRTLADLLDLARERVKLVTVSACWSAAVRRREQRRLLGLPERRRQSRVPMTTPQCRRRGAAPLGRAGDRAGRAAGVRGAGDALPGRTTSSRSR